MQILNIKILIAVLSMAAGSAAIYFTVKTDKPQQVIVAPVSPEAPRTLTPHDRQIIANTAALGRPHHYVNP